MHHDPGTKPQVRQQTAARIGTGQGRTQSRTSLYTRYKHPAANRISSHQGLPTHSGRCRSGS
jgi:hypothetical protein